MPNSHCRQAHCSRTIMADIHLLLTYTFVSLPKKLVNKARCDSKRNKQTVLCGNSVRCHGFTKKFGKRDMRDQVRDRKFA